MKSNVQVVEEYVLGDHAYKVQILSNGVYSITFLFTPSSRARDVLTLIPYYFDLSHILERQDEVIVSLAKRLNLSKADIEWIKAKLSGYDILYPLMLDNKITDIKVMSNRQVIVRHQEYGDLRVKIQGKQLILKEHEVRNLAISLMTRTGTSINVKNPLVDGAKLGKDRIVVSIIGTPYITVRKFPRPPWMLHKLIAKGMLTAKTAALLWLLNEYKVPIMIYGPMGSGKTSLAGAIIATAKPKASIVIIQDMPEINIAHPYAYYLYPTPTIKYSRLLSYALRTSSEYLIVNEIRNKEEAVAFVQAINTGHGGITTIHAESVQGIISRLKHYGLTYSDISTLKVFVRTSIFDKRVKGLKTYDRKVLKVELLEGINNGVPSLSTFVEYEVEENNWIEEIEPHLMNLLQGKEYDRCKIKAKLRVREVWLSTLADRYMLSGLVETSEEWYSYLKKFYLEEERLLNSVYGFDEPQLASIVSTGVLRGYV